MINGKILRDSIISAANNISNNRQLVDQLNVFPVPDGDTGTNMSMTINAAKKTMLSLDDNCTVSEVAKLTASSLLRGARGNSGVILSLIFRGFNKSLSDKEFLCAKSYATALSEGISAAYKAVMKPTEGTILTVCRMASEKATLMSNVNDDFLEVFETSLEEAKIALEQTPELLPVLKKAGVVDSGGKGFVIILEGMLSVFKYNKIIECNNEENEQPIVSVNNNQFKGEIDPNMCNGYCTEFIINLNKNVDESQIMVLRAYLESMGDSVVVADDDDIIKIHVHTDDPGRALSEGKKYGYLTNMKIENMLEQYKEMLETGKMAYHPKNDGVTYKSENTENINKNFQYVKPSGQCKFGFVAISSGEGLQKLFEELGVNAIVTGGQTMNPSTDDILNAIMSIDAEIVFVLPNNKNIIMAAEQAIPFADRKVIVLQTTTIPQGISAMLNFDTDCSEKENEINMTNAIDKVSTGLITFAARNSDFDGHKIKKGQILALNNGKLAFTESDIEKAVIKLTKQMIKKDSEFITIISGKDVLNEKAEQILSVLEDKLPSNIEVSYLSGGQPVYYFIIYVE
ncbi:MAG: DAK2 domain-containing protein [Oscillospiraceae bacterium]